MLPPAPGLFSTTTCWPHISDSRAPRMRAMPSMPPPGVNGTISLTTRVGHGAGACAGARWTSGSWKAGDVAASATRRRRVIMMVLSASSVDADTGRLDDRTPLVDVGLEILRELVDGRADHRVAELFEPRLDRGLGKRRGRICVDFPDDIGRRSRRQQKPVPGRDFEARYACLGHGRQLRGGRLARGAGNRKSAELPRPDEVERDAARELEVDASWNEVVVGGPGATIGHVGHLDASHALEQLAGHVRGRADAGRRIGELASLLLGVGDEL